MLCFVLSSRQFVPSAGQFVQSAVSLSNLLWVVSNLLWVEISFCSTKYVLSEPTGSHGSHGSHFLEPWPCSPSGDDIEYITPEKVTPPNDDFYTLKVICAHVMVLWYKESLPQSKHSTFHLCQLHSRCFIQTQECLATCLPKIALHAAVIVFSRRMAI